MLPEKIQEVLQKNEEILKEVYPIDYELLPFDRIKEYTWHAKIPKIQIQKIDKFIQEIDWENMDESSKKRNEVGQLIVYQRDENCKTKIVPSLPGFSEDFGPINIQYLDKNFNCKEKIMPLSYEQIKPNIFPSIKIFKNIEI